MSEDHWRKKAGNNVLLARARMLKNIRAFFDARDVLEVETPLLSHYATTDLHIDTMSARFRDQQCFLNTSPEYAMKRLLACWEKPVYQICKAFRDNELGTYHNPEFTLLEWYRPGYDMRELMAELADLVAELCFSLATDRAGNELRAVDSFHYISYRQAFENSLGFNPHQATAKQCYQLATGGNIEIPQGLGMHDPVDDWLDWLLTQIVIPSFTREGFTFLYDYPASQCALAKLETVDRENPVARRFELFYGEIELANGFHELSNAEEQLQRFRLDNEKRQQAGRALMTIDDNLISALRAGLPDCSGVAVGLDRLLMVLTGINSIEQVLSFSWENA